MIRWSLFPLIAFAMALACPVHAQTFVNPAIFDDAAKVPDPAQTVSVVWESIGEKEGGGAPAIQQLSDGGTAATNFGPSPSGGQPLERISEPGGGERIYVAESQEGLTGGASSPQGMGNPAEQPVKYRIYTIPAPVDPSLYDGSREIVTEFTDLNIDPSAANQVKVFYQWSISNGQTNPDNARLGTFEFVRTKADLELANQNGGNRLEDPTVLGGNAWLPFQDLDQSNQPTNVQPAPFNGREASGQLGAPPNDKVPDFSYAASTPGDYKVAFTMQVKQNDGSADGNPVFDNTADPVEKKIEVANLTPPMLMTGAVPGPVFSTTGDLLDNDLGDRTPEFPQDDPYTVVWVMSNAHTGTEVDPNDAKYVKKIEVIFPKFVKPQDQPDIALMPLEKHNFQVDPVTGKAPDDRNTVFNGGDTFGLALAADPENISGTPYGEISDTNPDAPRAIMTLPDGRPASEDFVPKMIAAVSKPDLTIDDFAAGTFQDKDLNKEIIQTTPGQEGLVGTIQLPSNFPMEECQMALLSAFKVKVPIERAPINFEGRVPWSVAVTTQQSPNGEQKLAGKMAGFLSVIDNDPPDVTIAVQNPRTGDTKILKVAGSGGGDFTLAPEPFTVRKGDLEVRDNPASDDNAQTEVGQLSPEQEVHAWPGDDKFEAAIDGGVIQLPDNRPSIKSAVHEKIVLPADTVPADEDVRLTVSLFPTDNVSSWEELYVQIFTEESGSGGGTPRPEFEGTMRKFKDEMDGRFNSNARSSDEQGEIRVVVYDFDPSKVPYRGASENPADGGNETVRLFANSRTIVLPVSRGGVGLQMQEIQSESERGEN